MILFLWIIKSFHGIFFTVAEPHHFDAAPAPGKNVYAAPAPEPAPALAPTLLVSMPKFKMRKNNIKVEGMFLLTLLFFIRFTVLHGLCGIYQTLFLCSTSVLKQEQWEPEPNRVTAPAPPPK
jgi:hypothetical protein